MCDSKWVPLFAVIRTRGPAWQADLRLEGQRQWQEHADFMDRLAAAGVIVLGGPLESTPKVLLVMRADTAEAIHERLLDDPWTNLDLLRIESIARWTLRLGTLPSGT
jgi:hypothetical protein